MDVQLVNARKKLYKSTRAKFLKLSTDNVHVFFPFLISGTATFCYRVGVLKPYLLMYLVCRSIFLEFILTITAVVVGFISSEGFY